MAAVSARSVTFAVQVGPEPLDDEGYACRRESCPGSQKLHGLAKCQAFFFVPFFRLRFFAPRRMDAIFLVQ